MNYFNPANTDRVTGPLSPGGNAPGNVVEVSVKLDMVSGWIAPLSGKFNDSGAGYSSFVLHTYSSSVLGAYPYGVLTVAR